jgi:hypothetical protein
MAYQGQDAPACALLLKGQHALLRYGYDIRQGDDI